MDKNGILPHSDLQMNSKKLLRIAASHSIFIREIVWTGGIATNALVTCSITCDRAGLSILNRDLGTSGHIALGRVWNG